MKLYCKLQYHPIDTIVLGFFDGLHIAHRNIINTAIALGGKTAVITFAKNPLEYLQEHPVSYISTYKQRVKMFEDIGLDYVYMLDFAKVMNVHAEDYLKNYLIKNFRPKNIVSGFNHRFGAKKEGDTKLLEKKGAQWGYDYLKIGKIELDGRLVSSTNIKYLITQGRIEEANTLLGRYFGTSGRVIKGNRLGHTIGYPTANIHWRDSIVKLPYGVYFGDVVIENKLFQAIINWGTRCSVSEGGEPVLEAHILDFDEDIYDREITMYFEKRIREQMKFPNLQELKKQIDKDVSFATSPIQ